MLTKTVRQMESDGLVKRTVYPINPPRVEYQLTTLGRSLSAAFCGVWLWAEAHHDELPAHARPLASTLPSRAGSRTCPLLVHVFEGEAA